MCFSVGASFTAAISLSVVGVLTWREVRQRALYGIAAIPFLFAAQQAAEGLVWLAPASDLLWTYLYLFFALLVWPVWIPFSLRMLEPSRNRMAVDICLFIGFLVASLFAYELWFHGARAEITQHISYLFASPLHLSPFLSAIFYCTPVIGSFFFTHNRMLHIYGILLAVGALLSMLGWQQWFASIWCFFAAILSLSVWYFVREYQRSSR